MNRTCYVSMPYGRKVRPETGEEIDFDAVYQTLLRPAVEEAELECIRADSFAPGLLLENLFRSILESRLVIADLTLQNPNVLYELGIRHALRPTGTILIQAAGAPVPFDLNQVMVMLYPLAEGRITEEDLPDARKRLVHLIERTLHAERADSPFYVLLPEMVPPESPAGMGTGFESTARGGLAGTGTSGNRDRLRRSVRSMVEQFGTGTGGQPPKEAVAVEEPVEGHVPLSVILEEFRRERDWDATIAYIDQLPPDKAQDRDAVHELALALCKRGGEGDLDRAVAVCEDLVAREGGDPDTLGILGRVLRSRYQERGDAEDLEAAIRAYRQAFELRPTEPYPGLAALTLLKLDARLGPQDELLLQVRDALGAKYLGLPEDAWSFWDLASRLDLVVFARDWEAANETVRLLLRASSEAWQLNLVRQNLERIVSASPEDQEPIARLSERLTTAGLTEGGRS